MHPMDPVTQGALGAAATLATLDKRASVSTPALAAIGCLSGMAADLDILIRSAADPLLKIEFHRHFTHSLVFIPIGALLSALPWVAFARWRKEWRWVIAATSVGYATHAVLDACTTYGTLLYWPFSNHRVSWRFISVIDPLLTIPLLVGVILAIRRKNRSWAAAGLIWALLILSFGSSQRSRAETTQQKLAARRGHSIERGAVLPTFANNVAWRSLYRHDGRVYIDKVRVPWFQSACVTPGTDVAMLTSEERIALAGQNPATQRAVRLIYWFASDWVARDSEDPHTLGDIRYSFSPTEALPIWGVRVNAKTGLVEWVNNRSKHDLTLSHLVAMVTTNGPNSVCLD